MSGKAARDLLNSLHTADIQYTYGFYEGVNCLGSYFMKNFLRDVSVCIYKHENEGYVLSYCKKMKFSRVICVVCFAKQWLI